MISAAKARWSKDGGYITWLWVFLEAEIVQQRYLNIVDEEDPDGLEAQSKDDFRPLLTWTESEIILHFCSSRQSIPKKDILEKWLLPVANEQRRKNGSS